jgi:hypothetical protein
VSERETPLGEDVDGGVPGYGRTIDEAIQDAYDKGKSFGAKPGWFAVERVFVYVENPIREYKVVVSPGNGQ